MIDNSHIVAVRTAVDVVVGVLLSLEMVSLNKLALRLNPILPCTCPSRNSPLFIVHFNHAIHNINVTEGNRTFSIRRYVDSFI